MLYDKRWDRTEAKPDVLSLESLIAWLQKQPADKAYDWHCMGECLFHQYLIAHGEDWNTNYHKLRERIRDGGRNSQNIFIALHTPHTFGAALERARSVVPSAHHSAQGE